MRAIGLFFVICLFVFSSVGTGFYFLEEVTDVDVLSYLSDDAAGELLVLILIFTFIQSVFLTLIAVGILHRKEAKDVVVVNTPSAPQSSVQDELNRLKIRELEHQVDEMRRQQEHTRYMPPQIGRKD